MGADSPGGDRLLIETAGNPGGLFCGIHHGAGTILMKGAGLPDFLGFVRLNRKSVLQNVTR